MTFNTTVPDPRFNANRNQNDRRGGFPNNSCGGNPWMEGWFHNRDDGTRNAILNLQKNQRCINKKQPPPKRSPPLPPDYRRGNGGYRGNGNNRGRGRGRFSGRGRNFSNNGRNYSSQRGQNFGSNNNNNGNNNGGNNGNGNNNGGGGQNR